MTVEANDVVGSVVENESGKSTPLSDDVVPTPRHMEFTTNAELNLSCCILMLDILLKQVRLLRDTLSRRNEAIEMCFYRRWSCRTWTSTRG